MFALVWFLPGVSWFVLFQLTNCSERLSTHITGERFVPCVCAQVIGETSFGCTSVRTERAGKGFLSRVKLLMGLQILPCVLAKANDEIRFIYTSVRTEAAGEESFAGVHAYVLVQVTFTSK